ncbi:hypothetical protein CCICO_08620 [Corynebacterium ciconiae DSM 44920]|uniref:GAP family protein n=1 Tax=Corynebacterium ciconiae TaxID=227319 RepID=UPI0003705E3A|nr:GAP family protein [Corynebacterium ciconiae]WKD61733.1 hypothetical protein CCICO_08620 [Corynebacterium ciconiae DSM 44920]
MIDLLALIPLALVDSLSAGTLVLPIVLLIVWQRLIPKPYIVYLGTIGTVYFLLGLGLFWGAEQLTSIGTRLAQWPVSSWVLFVLGCCLAAYGILSPNPRKRSAEEIVDSFAAKQKGMSAAPWAMAMLALSAAVVEVGTMLPYLTALGILRSSEIATAGSVLALAVYCLIMIAPAALIGLIARRWGPQLRAKLIPYLPRLEYETKVTVLWIAAIVGITLAVRNFGAVIP